MSLDCACAKPVASQEYLQVDDEKWILNHINDRNYPTTYCILNLLPIRISRTGLGMKVNKRRVVGIASENGIEAFRTRGLYQR